MRHRPPPASQLAAIPTRPAQLSASPAVAQDLSCLGVIFRSPLTVLEMRRTNITDCMSVCLIQKSRIARCGETYEYYYCTSVRNITFTTAYSLHKLRIHHFQSQIQPAVPGAMPYGWLTGSNQVQGADKTKLLQMAGPRSARFNLRL